MTIFDDRGHARTDALQALLDGTLPDEAGGRVREHVDACVRCRGELEAWSLVFERLGDLPELVPEAGFAGRVMEGFRGRASLAARIRARLRGILPTVGTAPGAHPGPGRIQDHVDGLLRGRDRRTVKDHLAGCPACAREAETWKGLIGRIEQLPRPMPSLGFAARVMEGLEASGATAKAPTVARPVGAGSRSYTDWRGVAARVGRAAAAFVPSTRKGWATLTGIALTPTVVLITLVWAVAAHPLVTLDGARVFLGWKLSGIASTLWTGAVELAVESPFLFRGWELLVEVASPTTALASGLLLATAMAVSLWTLYRNLIGSRHTDASHVRISS